MCRTPKILHYYTESVSVGCHRGFQEVHFFFVKFSQSALSPSTGLTVRPQPWMGLRETRKLSITSPRPWHFMRLPFTQDSITNIRSVETSLVTFCIATPVTTSIMVHISVVKSHYLVLQFIAIGLGGSSQRHDFTLLMKAALTDQPAGFTCDLEHSHLLLAGTSMLWKEIHDWLWSNIHTNSSILDGSAGLGMHSYWCDSGVVGGI